MNAIRRINSSDDNLYNPRHIGDIMSEVLAKYEPVVTEDKQIEKVPFGQQNPEQPMLPRSDVAALAEVYLANG